MTTPTPPPDFWAPVSGGEEVDRAEIREAMLDVDTGKFGPVPA